jgi:hypothetical protein
MKGARDTSIDATAAGAPRSGTRLECRECQVICERVVSPWRCLRANHTCVYAFKDGDSTYFGCLHKVFSPELDLQAFAGGLGESRSRTDPYGPVRVVRAPRPQCPVSVERAYLAESAREHCVNPGFLREGFRVLRGDEARRRITGHADGHTAES